MASWQIDDEDVFRVEDDDFPAILVYRRGAHKLVGLGGTVRWMRLNWAPLWVRQGAQCGVVVTNSRGKRVRCMILY